jgi:hypothetical protein
MQLVVGPTTKCVLVIQISSYAIDKEENSTTVTYKSYQFICYFASMLMFCEPVENSKHK